MQQQRFIIFLVLAVAILFGWNYFFPTKAPQPANTNNSNIAQSQSSPAQQASQSPAQQPSQSPVQQAAQGTKGTTPGQAQQQNPAAPAVQNVEHREFTVETPLYKVKFDNRGAVATSWIITKDKTNGRDLSSVSSTKGNPQPLELIPDAFSNPSKYGLNPEDKEAPLRIVTGDPVIDAALATRNYAVTGVDASTPTVKVGAGGSQAVQFTMHDDATGVDITKKLTFRGDLYNVEFSTTLTKNGQPLPEAKVAIGPSIGDQGVPKYTFYSYAPEGVASVNNAAERHAAQAVSDAKESPNNQVVGGNIDWAGIGDTYFAMVAIPAKPVSGLVYKTVKYEHILADGKKDSRYLITGYIPVPTDGSTNALYVGPKDHNILAAANTQISSELHRPIDLDGLFNYGWFAGMKRALAFPILASINWFHKITGSYGVAIILFTILLYSLFFPLKWRSSKSMKKAQKLAPRMKELQEKIKGMKQNDPRLKELQKEQLLLMKEGNPLGGCLPLLIQMPFLFALYSAITVSIDFRQSSFLWMPDLSMGDPYHLLEILMAGSMVVLQLVTPAPSADPLQRKMMAFTMPAFMLYILWGAPAGLLVYWLVGNIVGFSQQFLINYFSKTDEDKNSPEQPGDNKGKRSTKKLNAPRTSEA
jgi:YidC/Oxa1 family membrane protein insertase